MSQEDILKILKAKPNKWFCKNDLLPLVDINRPSLVRSMSRLVKYRSAYNLKFKKGKRNKQYLKF